MISKPFLRAWKHYQREGINSLAFEMDKRIRRLIPFRYRLYYRIEKQKFVWEDAAIIQPTQIFNINPDQIQYNGPRFDRSKYVGKIKAGKWDKNRSQWGGTTYDSLYNRFINDFDWENTQYYKNAKEKIKNNGYYLGYTNFDTFKTERLSYLDELFENIRSNGYKTQRELGGDNRDTNRHQSILDSHLHTHEIGCNIARDGTLLFNSGKHRLCIAKILDIDEIPVQIIVRHKNWMKIRQDVALSKNKKKAVNKKEIDPNHPDLRNLFDSDTSNDANPK